MDFNAYHARKEPHFWIINFDDENHWKPRNDIVKTMIHINQNQFKTMQIEVQKVRTPQRATNVAKVPQR